MLPLARSLRLGRPYLGTSGTWLHAGGRPRFSRDSRPPFGRGYAAMLPPTSPFVCSGPCGRNSRGSNVEPSPRRGPQADAPPPPGAPRGGRAGGGVARLALGSYRRSDDTVPALELRVRSVSAAEPPTDPVVS